MSELKNRRAFVVNLAQVGTAGAVAPLMGQNPENGYADGAVDRAYWVTMARLLAEPVLTSLSEGRLRSSLPDSGERSGFAPLEALGRLLTGLAPWLELGDDGTEEGRQRANLAELARSAIAMAVDPQSPDFMNFTEGTQPLVDAAFLAQALNRAPVQLWQQCDFRTRENIVFALLSTRRITPHYNNWLLFSAMIEATLLKLGLEWDAMRVDLAVRTVQRWYLGDGIYSDGPDMHCDYYNSYVIQPFMLEITENASRQSGELGIILEKVKRISNRFASILERLIAPDGTYPPIGRSLVYRCAAFQLLSQLALRNELPPELPPAQVRSALTAVIRRQLGVPATFDNQGWLTLGFCGAQPSLAEGYISSGSPYLCSTILLALGLPASHPFWIGPGLPWTSRRVWSGEDVSPDKSLHGRMP